MIFGSRRCLIVIPVGASVVCFLWERLTSVLGDCVSFGCWFVCDTHLGLIWRDLFLFLGVEIAAAIAQAIPGIYMTKASRAAEIAAFIPWVGSLLLNIGITTAIIVKLVWFRRRLEAAIQIPHALGPRGFRPAISVLVESGVVYVVPTIVAIILYFAGRIEVVTCMSVTAQLAVGLSMMFHGLALEC